MVIKIKEFFIVYGIIIGILLIPFLILRPSVALLAGPISLTIYSVLQFVMCDYYDDLDPDEEKSIKAYLFPTLISLALALIPTLSIAFILTWVG